MPATRELLIRVTANGYRTRDLRVAAIAEGDAYWSTIALEPVGD